MSRWMGVFVIAGITALAWTVEVWAPGLLELIDKEGGRIQSLQALVQLILWIAAGLAALLFLFRPARKEKPASVRTGGGAYVNGPIHVKGDFVSGDKSVNVGSVEKPREDE